MTDPDRSLHYERFCRVVRARKLQSGVDLTVVGTTLSEMLDLNDARATSPCIGACVLDRSNGFCVGCYRSRDEVTGWRDIGVAGREAVLAQLPARRLAAAMARGA